MSAPFEEFRVDCYDAHFVIVPRKLNTKDISKAAQFVKRAIEAAISFEHDNDYRINLERKREQKESHVEQKGE